MSLLCWHLLSAYWKYPVPLQTQDTAAQPVPWCCCMNGSVFSTAMVTQGLTGTQAGHHQPSFGAAPSCPGLPCQAQGAFQGGARAEQGLTAQECLTTNTFSSLLVYQTELGMQINWCKCKINSINSCKIKAWLFSEILPGSQVHWATVTLSPLKIFKVERQVFCHYYSLMRFGHSSAHRKCTLIVLSVLKNYILNLIFAYLST